MTDGGFGIQTSAPLDHPALMTFAEIPNEVAQVASCTMA